ncbi:putative periplasmic protein kinase ArgK [Lunatimonas lonarensis]|uniref:Putative periplasmic protein kinase ArgK n=1 Tax=Lunatimonas lonarensis TaxID=1232681 RepID=R7ZPT9_9BACT|nr:methylmalonyl Co-A mutase-associated GTPase MeaB [Lunatimonas lonarensis]EON76115.1 putative periplasmic protein kinase ArgK [Lunatimonas lonarensis]
MMIGGDPNGKRGRLDLETYVTGILSGERAILSRAITLVESTLDSDRKLAGELMERLLPYSGKSLRIGITGAPGVGKSTFIDAFGQLLALKGHQVAVLSIDPSSIESKGSVLGDKTRMERLALNPSAYIRPSPSQGLLGGVSAATREASLLCEAAGFDRLIIETVGVGQSEVAVKQMVDVMVFLTMPGAGDELQGIKKGIMETADLILVNKADGDRVAASLAKEQVENALKLASAKPNGWKPRVLSCSSLRNDGIEEVLTVLEEFVQTCQNTGFIERNRAEQRVHWLREQLKYLLEKRFFENEAVRREFPLLGDKVREGHVSTFAASNLLLAMYIESIKSN